MQVLVSQDALDQAGEGVVKGLEREVPVKGKSGTYRLTEVTALND